MSSHPDGAPRPPPLERLLARRIEINWVVVAYVAIFAAAFILRFWDLGARALHHDESIHAKWAWDFAQGSYRHNPTFHGPLLYVVQGFSFLVATATDYTSRISPALFGMAVVAAPFALRRWLGSPGVFAAVALLAFSPTLVYFSRFLRMDIYLALFILVMVAAVWHYLHDGRTRWLIVLAVALALAYSTKEAAFLFVAFLLLYLNGRLAVDLVAAVPRPAETRDRRIRLAAAAALFPVAWVVAGLWPILSRLGRRVVWDGLPRSADLLLLTGTLTLPLLVAFAKVPIEVVFATNPLDYPGVCTEPDARAAGVLVAVFAVAIGLAALAGLSWRPRTWLISAAIAIAIYATLMTSLWTNAEGLCSGAWGSIDYWLAQQEVRRGEQPWFYYLMLMPAYEFLPLVLALAGGVWAALRGSSFARFLVLWFVALFFALSLAGEKMPWLNTHLAIPAILLAAWTIHEAWRSWRRPTRLDTRSLLLIAFTLASAALTLVVFAHDWGPTLDVRLTWGLVPLLVTITAAGFVGARLGWRRLPLLGVLVVIAALAFFSLRTMIGVTFERGDVPEDMLIYTQSSPEIARLADDIDALAEATGRGADLRIAIDTRTSFAWPWVWYLRDYREVTFRDMQSGLPPGEFDVILANAHNGAVVTADLAERGATGFAPPAPYRHHLWFPENYKKALTAGPFDGEAWRQIGNGIFRGSWARDAFVYWRGHEAPSEFGSNDGLAWFPASFDRETRRLTIQAVEPSLPDIDDAGRPFFGGLGSRPGQFSVPIDIARGPDGSLYVIDSATGLLQRFDSEGHFLAATELRRGDAPTGPWGLAVSSEGRVYVADTFGWRVVAYDASLHERLFQFGEPPPPAGERPGSYELFGPRDLAIDADGNLWVTDTGHARIVVYSSAGEFLREIAGPYSAGDAYRGAGSGQFSEPVGIAIAPGGEVVVADMWNGRVQVLDSSGAYLREFPVAGWGGLDVLDKPYLTVLRDGRIALSVPSLDEVRIYSASGVLQATINPPDEPLRVPYGIAETADGKLWIVEGGAARVRLFDGAEAGGR